MSLLTKVISVVPVMRNIVINEIRSNALQQIVSFLEESRSADLAKEVGIFRISGSKSRVEEIIKRLTQSSEAKLVEVFSADELKKYLRMT